MTTPTRYAPCIHTYTYHISYIIYHISCLISHMSFLIYRHRNDHRLSKKSYNFILYIKKLCIYIYHYLSYIHYHIYIDNHRYIDISPKKQTAPPQTASANKAMLAEPRACRKPGATGGDWLVVEKLSHPSEKYEKSQLG